MVLHSAAMGGGIQARRAALVSQWIDKGYEVTTVCIKHEESVGASLQFRGEFIGLNVPPIRNALHPFYSFLPLVRFFKGRSFDVVLVGEIFTVAVTAAALKYSKNPSRLFVSLHNPIYEGHERYPSLARHVLRSALKALLKPAFRKAEGVIAISRGVLDSYVSEVGDAFQNSRVIYNPVIDRSLMNDEVAVPGLGRSIRVPKRAIAIGRLHYQKGYDLLVRAISLCRSEVELYIYGDGPMRSDLAALIARSGLESRVFLKGKTSDPIGAISDGDLFVLSSRWEGLGNVLVEALYCNRPVVAFDCPGGVREVLGSGEFGVLVENGDVQELARAIDDVTVNCVCNERWRDFEVNKVAEEYLDFMVP